MRLRRISSRSTARWTLLVLWVLGVVNQGCAGGNWRHFSPERFESADQDGERVIRADVYDALVKAQKLSAGGRHIDALDLLGDLEQQVESVPTEKALVAQAKAYVLLTMGKLHEAVPAIETALQGESLPEATQQDLRYNLAQIYVKHEAYAKAAPVLEQWIAQSDQPDPKAIAMLGYIHYQQGHYDVAATYTKRALRISPGQLDWQKILLSCAYHQEDYPQARNILLQLIAREPLEASHWMALSRVDLLVNDPDHALASLDLAADMSQLEEQELLQRIRLCVHQGIPLRGATLLRQSLENGRVQATAAHWRLLAQAELAAKNFAAARHAFEQARSLSDDAKVQADLCLRMAGISLQLERWEDAQASARCAIASTDDQLRANANLVLGVASYQARDFSECHAALQAAQRHPATRQSAAQWEAMVLVQQDNLAVIAQAKTEHMPKDRIRNKGPVADRQGR